jgi:hypothetical protein
MLLTRAPLLMALLGLSQSQIKWKEQLKSKKVESRRPKGRRIQVVVQTEQYVAGPACVHFMRLCFIRSTPPGKQCQSCYLHALILPPVFHFGFFSYWLLLFLVHSMATLLFRLIGALGRSMVMANTFGSFALMVVFLLGGFILAKCECDGLAPVALTSRHGPRSGAFAGHSVLCPVEPG